MDGRLVTNGAAGQSGTTMNRIMLLVAVALAATGTLLAQTRVSSGDLAGSVSDSRGAGIRGARVTAAAEERGISRGAVTGESGEYRVPLLPPGVYTVRVEATGFTTHVMTGATVLVGQTLTLNAQLEVGAVSTEVTIAADAPVVETERTQQASIIDLRRMGGITDQPAQLPGLRAALTRGGGDQPPRGRYGLPRRPGAAIRVELWRGNGRGNAFTIDGLANYYNSGGVRPSVSQEAVQEFQINRNSFTAEFGGAVGGAINIVTRSGTNQVHGDVFGFLRHREIQARNFFDPSKSAFTRGQYGATPAARSSATARSCSGAFERLDRHETAFVPILQDRSAFGQAHAFPAAACRRVRPLCRSCATWERPCAGT